MKLSRRQALRSAAATFWLPFLPSALTREARASLEPPPRRLVIAFLPHGLQHVHVAPSGSTFETRHVTEPTVLLPGRVSIVTNLNNGLGNNDHGGATTSLLTDVDPNYNLVAGTSVDQYAVQALQPPTPFASLQLAANTTSLFSNSSVGGILSSTLSWSTAQTPMAALSDARTVFNRLFQGNDVTESEADQMRRRELRKSVIDGVLERNNSLASRLSAEDRLRLEQYTTGLRQLEQRIDRLDEIQCEPTDVPGVSLGFSESVDAMQQLIELALTCDLTRVVTFLYGPSAAETTLPELSISQGHHQLSHQWAYDNLSDQRFQDMNRWHVERWMDLCGRLATPGQEEDTLDQTLMVLASEFSDANAHRTDQLAMLVAGGEASGTRPGRHINAGGAPHANMLRAMLSHMEVNPSGFSDRANGTLSL